MSAAPARMNPFPGLRPFAQEEDYLFFGREEQTIELLQRLGGNRFVAVVGASGSGKSSLVRCGLLSELLGGRMLEAGASWEIAVTHPGGNPLALLTDALLEADLYDRGEEHARENLLATLSRSHFGLVEAVKQADLAEGTNFLLVVDQFEEIFRFHEAGQTQQEVANEFVSLLLEGAAKKDVPIYVVLTMRSDFIGECGQFEGLAEKVNRGEFLIPKLNRDQYKRVIEGPIKVAGGQIAPRLLQRLLNDLGQQADQLPCLQHALMRTWNVWREKGDADALDLDDYQRVGKMSQALSLHADEIYESLAGDRERELCQGLFQALTVEESNSRGIRRPQRLGRLCQILEVPAGELRPIIDAYRQSGVTFLMPAPDVELTDQTIVDISHESLMRVWTRLRQWVEEETQAAGIYHRLSESAALRAQGKAGLYRDPELGIALAWRESKRPNAAWAERYRLGFATAMEFLEASRRASVAEEQALEAARQRELDQARQLAEAQQLRLEHQQRAARKLRAMIGGLAVVAIVAVLACVAALALNQRANELAVVAKQKSKVALAYAADADRERKTALEAQKATEQALTQVESQKARAETSLTKAETAERVARSAEEAGRKLLYTTDMRLAPFVWSDDHSTADKLRILLAKHVPDGKAAATSAPADLKPDLRGFEWYYYQHLLGSSAAVFSGHESSVIAAAFTSDGRLATLDQNGQYRRWDLDSRVEDQASRRDLLKGAGAAIRVLSPDGRSAALADGNKVHIFDTSSGTERCQIDSAYTDTGIRLLIFTPDGGRLVILDDKIRWCDTVSGQAIASLDQRYDRVQSLALSADGSTLAVVGHGSSGTQLSIFRLDAAERKVTPLAKDAGVGGTQGAAALSPDGRLIAVGAALGGAVVVFDSGTGRSIAKYVAAHASNISALAFAGDGVKLASADVEGTIKIWADARKLTSKSAALMTFKGHQGEITHLAFSSTGKQLVSTSADKTARVWDLDKAGAAIRGLERSERCLVARFSPDGQLIAVADFGGNVRLWDAATGKLVRRVSTGEPGRVCSVAFSPTDNRLLAVGYGGKADVSYVALWDIDSGKELARLPGATDLPDFGLNDYNGTVGALAFSPDGKYLVAGFGSRMLYASSGPPNPLKVWEVATRRLIRRLSGHTGYCVSLDFSRDGTLLASGSHDGTAILWSTVSWKATQTRRNPDRDSLFSELGRPAIVEAVAFSSDGKTLAMASEGNVHLWNVASGNLLETMKGHSSSVHALVFSPDGRTLASGSGDQTVRLWNVETRRELLQLASGNFELGQVFSLAFSPDGKHLLAGGLRGCAFWSTAPDVWNDPDQAAQNLRRLLRSNADFPSRVRLLSENLRLHEALAGLDANDVRVRAALAAAQANWHASRKAWPEAAAAFDRLKAADPTTPEAWLRTPGLLRLATALLHQNRPRDAAALLTGGAKRRAADGLPDAVDQAGLGVAYSVDGAVVLVTELLPGFPRPRTGLRPGDVIVKVDGTELTRQNIPNLRELLTGKPGTKVKLTVRHSGSEQPDVIELTREQYVHDEATGELLDPLRVALKERLARDSREPGLLELKAAIAGQWSGFTEQAADLTAAIEVLKQRKPEPTAELQRLYRRRGDACVGLKQWQRAVDDYAQGVTGETTDLDLLANQALARAESLLGIETLAPTSEQEGAKWHFTTQKPADNWAQPSFKDASWRVGEAPFGTTDVNQSRIAWTTPDIWLRRGFEFDKARNAKSRYLLRVFCDDIAEVFLNGKPLGRREGETFRQFVVLELEEHVRDLFVPGSNTLAVHCTNLRGPGLIDVGLYAATDSSLALAKKRFAAGAIGDLWTKLATAYRLRGDQKAIDQLVERHPNLAGRIGDLFIQDEDKDWPRAVEIYSRGITPRTTDVELLSKRALAHEALKNWAAAAADWSRAAAGNLEEAKLLAEFAQRLAGAGQVSLANARFAKAQALDERSLAADPDNDVAATELTQLLVNKSANENSARWTTLTPTEMKSEKGASLTRQDDGSILASGINADGDVYTISVVAKLDRIAAVRLEALPDASLPSRGPGRHESGNFHLAAFRLSASPSDGEKALRPVPVASAWASFDYKRSNADIAGTIDESLKKTWHVWGHTGQAHQADFLLKEPVPAQDRRFVIELRNGKEANLGRFRLSVTGDPARSERDETRLAALKATDPWAKLGAAYALNGRQDEALRFFGRALEWADGYEARKPILELAARFDDIISGLAQRRPSDLQLQLALARNLAQRGTRRLAEKQPAKAQADLEKSRVTFTRLRAASRWTVLTPTELKSEQGATLTTQDDLSIQASGQNPPNDSYTLAFRHLPPLIRGLRLDVLPHESLPNHGPGRGDNGNFWLTTVEAQLDSPGHAGASSGLKLAKAYADFSEPGHNVSSAIDANDYTYWSIFPGMGKPHAAVLELAAPVTTTESAELRVTLEFKCRVPRHTIGRFRLSVTDDAETLARAASLPDLMDSELVDVSVTLAQAQAQQGHIDEAAVSFAVALGLAPDSAGKAKIITEAAALKGVLEKLAEHVADDPRILDELGQLDDVLAELHRRLPNDKPIQDAYLKRIDKAAAEFSRKLDALPDRRESWADRSQLILSVIRRRSDVFESLLKLRPKDSLLPVCAARDSVLKSDWSSAASAYAGIVETLPLYKEWYEYAAALLLANKTKEYAEFMKQAAAKAGDQPEPLIAFFLARAAAISPTPAVPPEKAVRWAERALGESKNSWFPHTAGLAHLRAGNDEQALKYLGESLVTPWCPQLNHLALSLVHAQRKDAAQAREHLKLAEKWFQDQASLKTNGYFNGQVTDWLEANLLLREAKAVIEGNDAAKEPKK